MELADTAPGLSLTRLRRWLADGTPPTADRDDWTAPPCPPPTGPAGFALTRLRTSHAGQTVEAWILPDGTWEIHLHSENVAGNRSLWYLREPDPATARSRIRTCVAQRCARSSLRIFLDGERLLSAVGPASSVFHVEHADPVAHRRLDLIFPAQGELVLFHRGFLVQRAPCPVPHLHFEWDTSVRSDAGDAADAVRRHFEVARCQLAETLASRVAEGAVDADAWVLFLSGNPGPEWMELPVGRDLRGLPFSTRDLVAQTVLPVSPLSTFPPVGAQLRLVDENVWSPGLLSQLRRTVTRSGRSEAANSGEGLAARRLTPEECSQSAAGACADWPQAWARLAARDPRLAFDGGLVLAELHQPNDGAWPFFPGPDHGDLVGLRVLPPAPWRLHGALWLGVNHPVVQRLATLAGPADAVWILARLVLLSQELEPDDEALS
ncbi:MAG: hypothetical protein CVU59_04405 [Deltaproteobacteria bacterium HGW-Deltaproteobacteria-17]|nr:MAG: hypothetical protein CVU59_04405 [Deltaproteobacteria bacterium HGW-Deltaproteobacteria-17]